jgi:hypothetical protein
MDANTTHRGLYIFLSNIVAKHPTCKRFQYAPKHSVALPVIRKEGCGTAVPRLRQLAAGLSPRRPGFDAGSVHVGFVVDKVALGQVFPPEYFSFPLSVSFHPCSST